MASRFSVNKADPTVFISADDVRDEGVPSSPVTVDSPLSTGSSAGKLSSAAADAGKDEPVFADTAGNVGDQPEGNSINPLLHFCLYC